MKRQREETQRERDEWESWKKGAKEKTMEEYRRQLAKLQEATSAEWQRQKDVEWVRRKATKRVKKTQQEIVYVED